MGHNVADSFAAGMGFMIGVFQIDVFGEAQCSEGGAIVIDFLEGSVVEGDSSPSLRRAVALYRDALPEFCSGSGGSIEDFRALKVRYWSTHTDRRFSVTVEDASGLRSTTEYEGIESRRSKAIDDRGRLRPLPHRR
jgi:hypothetical protein